MAKVRVRLVSLLREAVGGKSEIELELGSDRATLAEAIARLFEEYPRLRSLVEELEQRGLVVIYTVNGYGASRDAIVADGDEIAILPPASGG
jgi:MoaD family protein